MASTAIVDVYNMYTVWLQLLSWFTRFHFEGPRMEANGGQSIQKQPNPPAQVSCQCPYFSPYSPTQSCLEGLARRSKIGLCREGHRVRQMPTEMGI